MYGKSYRRIDRFNPSTRRQNDRWFMVVFGLDHNPTKTDVKHRAINPDHNSPILKITIKDI